MCRDSLQYVSQGKIYGQDSKKSVPQHGKGVCVCGGGGGTLFALGKGKERALFATFLYGIWKWFQYHLSGCMLF